MRSTPRAATGGSSPRAPKPSAGRARWALPEALDPGLAEALRRAGIESLYTHQLEAFEAAAHSNLAITSGTASGKSLAFNLPVLDGIARQPKRRALYLYPTKALAQDQARKLAELRPPGLREAIYDGDTPREERPAIRRRNNLVLTNPDMLHVGLLPNHKSWGDFLANLGWVVVDEAHTYRGVFGSHVANVLRRLRRVARAYGSEPRFLLASATIANPVELAERLVGTPFELIDDDGAPRAGREIAMWNPPLIDKASGTRRSALSEAADLLAELVSQGVRTICFLKSRRGIELIQRFARENLERRGKPELAERIAPYRGGYTPQQRREIEAELSAGELLAVVATDALELGIDVGELDAAICVTFPGTVASLRQMWGRAGRRRRGLAVYVAGQDALDQFFCRHPEEFLERPVEAAILDHDNDQIASRHLIAAAYELPLSDEDDEIFGEGWRERAERLTGGRGAARRRRPAAAAARRVRRLADPPALGLGRLGRGDRARLGRDAGPGRGRARLHHGPPGRRLPPPRPLLRGRAARRRGAAGGRLRLRRRLVHAAEKGDRDLHRARARAARGRRRAAQLRRGLGHRAGDRLPAGLDLRAGADRHRRPRAARAELRHPGALVRAAGAAQPGRCRPRPCSAPCTRPSTARSRCCR